MTLMSEDEVHFVHHITSHDLLLLFLTHQTFTMELQLLLLVSDEH